MKMKKFLSGVVAACVGASCLSVTAIADDAPAAPAPHGFAAGGPPVLRNRGVRIKTPEPGRIHSAGLRRQII